jgi:hypothetical protein
MQSKAANVEEYLNILPPNRREAISKVRGVILKNLPAGYEEGIQYGMIGYYIPLLRYPKTYNNRPLGLAALASQKNYMSLYLMNIYANPETLNWFKDTPMLKAARSLIWEKAVSDSNVLRTSLWKS